MAITTNTNVASLQTQRRLGQTTSELQKCNERLSSGLGTNKASDDASGLAISTSLKGLLRFGRVATFSGPSHASATSNRGKVWSGERFLGQIGRVSLRNYALRIDRF